MPFQPVPETAQFRLQFLLDGQKCENVFHVRRQGEWDADNLNEIAGAFVGWWTTIGKTLSGSSCILQRCIGKDISKEAGMGVEYTAALPMAGTSEFALLPNNVAVAVKWGTGLAGRGFRGRTYHMGITLGFLQLGSNRLTSSYQNALRSGYDALRTALDNALLGVEFVVVTRIYNGVVRMPALTSPISGVSVEGTVDSMRRRLPGRGQ